MPTDLPFPFPPAPWRLRGHALISVWRVPLHDLPTQPPVGARLVTLAGHALCATVWAAYEPGGTLAYNELLFAAAVRKAGLLAPACTVGPIWVDDDAAAAGGRTLWSIPKRIGEFEPLRTDGAPGRYAAATTASLHEQGQTVAAMEFHPSLRIAVPLRLSVWTVQDAQAGPLRTRCTLRGLLRPGTAQWRIPRDGPLGFLAGRQPLACAQLERMSAWFGV